jgi:hypothetical protein
MTMTDTEITAAVERTDAFIERLRAAISEAVAAVNPHSPCADEARAGLARISTTLDAVPYVTLANLATLDFAMKNRVGSGLMSLVEARLMSVGGGPSLDFESAADFLARFKPLIDTVKRRRIN